MISAEDRITAGVGGRLDVAVVFTSAGATVAALRRAAALASGLNGRIVLLAAHVVPYPLALEDPAAPVAFTERLVGMAAAACPVETAVRVYRCRDPLHTLLSVLEPGSLVVVGGRKKAWPTAEQILAGRLRRRGHQVIFAPG